MSFHKKKMYFTRYVPCLDITGPEPIAAKAMGIWGSKVPLLYGPDEGHVGLKKSTKFLRKHRETVGPDYPIMVDCWMALNVQYTIELVTA